MKHVMFSRIFTAALLEQLRGWGNLFSLLVGMMLISNGLLAQNNWYDDYQCLDIAAFSSSWAWQNYDYGSNGAYAIPIQKNANGQIMLFDYCPNCGPNGQVVDNVVPLDAAGHPMTTIPQGYTRHIKWARSACGLAYYPRYLPIAYGPSGIVAECAPCACANGSTTTACDLLPDLVVSAWNIANDHSFYGGTPTNLVPLVSKGNELDPNTFKLKVNITVSNIGDGPFEIKRTHTGTNGLPLDENSDEDEIIKQVIYKKPAASGTMIEDISMNTNTVTGAYHDEHSHFHVNNWVDLSLRKRPTNSTDLNYNNPAQWTIVGTANKLSFCLVESNMAVCSNRYSMLDLRTNEQMAYLNANPNFWNNSDATLEDILTEGATDYGHKIMYNQLSDFPNLALGKYNYYCIGSEHQGIAPGYGDVYGADTPGNYINLPCDLAAGQYYIVSIVNAGGKFLEKQTDNNIAVVPYYFPGFSTNIPTEETVNVQSWSYQEAEYDNKATWTTPNRFNRKLIVPAGFTLTIQHTTMEFLTPQSGIVVEKGGTLILKDAILKNSDCLNNTWAGIESWGTVTIDGCDPLEAVVNVPPCHTPPITTLQATQNNSHISSFKAYSTNITSSNYLSSTFSSYLINTIPSGTMTYNNPTVPLTLVSVYNNYIGANNGCNNPSNNTNTSIIGAQNFRLYHIVSPAFTSSLTGITPVVCSQDLPTSYSISNPDPNHTYTYSFFLGPQTGAATIPVPPSRPWNSDVYSYNITIKEFDINGCEAELTTPLTANTYVWIRKQPLNTNTCKILLEAVVTTIPGHTYDDYKWYDEQENQIGTGPTYEASRAGVYYVSMKDNNNTCTSYSHHTASVLASDFVAPVDFSGTYTVGSMGSLAFATPNANGNETWNNLNKRMIGTIIIPTGKTLNINSSTLTLIGTETNIVVQPGGRLNLSAAILQTDQCSSTYWQGISVKGNAVAYTNPDPIIAFSSGNYGLVTATNSDIKNARVGICNGLVQANSVANVGGIIDINNTIFTDCGIAVRIAPTSFSNQQPHRINQCSFKMNRNTAFDANYWHPSIQQPIGIWAKDLILPNTLYNNKFVSTMPANTTPKDKRGIGIRLDNVRTTIDAPTNIALEFDGLSKGIDANNLLTTTKFVNLKRQDFGNIQKALTLNNTFGSNVSYCSFAVPPGTTSLLDTYGIMSYSSKGVIVEHNTFTTTNQANKYTKGIVFENSTNGNTPSSLNSNLFDGSFEAATQFKDSNAKLQTNCNAYDDCQIDWHLNANATLPEQGFCNPNNSNLALRTHWHYIVDPGLTGINDHIINSNNSFTLQLKIDDRPQSHPALPNPNYVEGLVNVEVCLNNLGNPVSNNSCNPAWLWPIFGEAKTSTECTNGNSLEQMLYDYIQQEQSDSLLWLLQCLEGEEWATQLLAGTYIDEGQYDMASAELQKLDSTSVENAEFIALCTAIMDSTLSSSEGGRMATALAQTLQIANNKDSKNKTLAEAVLSICRNADYVRHGEPINWKTNTPTGSNIAFNLVPNPAQDVVTIELSALSNEAFSLIIYDLSGKMVQTVSLQSTTTTISTQGLTTGMYLCKLSNSNQTQKLVIIK